MTGGFIAVCGTMLFDKLRIDDPVGALSVHGLSGIWVCTSLYCVEEEKTKSEPDKLKLMRCCRQPLFTPFSEVSSSKECVAESPISPFYV